MSRPSAARDPVDLIGEAHPATLVVSAPGSMDGYSRDKFPHWIAQPSYGPNCNTREAVLERDGNGVTTGWRSGASTRGAGSR